MFMLFNDTMDGDKGLLKKHHSNYPYKYSKSSIIMADFSDCTLKHSNIRL